MPKNNNIAYIIIKLVFYITQVYTNKYKKEIKKEQWKMYLTAIHSAVIYPWVPCFSNKLVLSFKVAEFLIYHYPQ